jgi:hypothetical protein
VLRTDDAPGCDGVIIYHLWNCTGHVFCARIAGSRNKRGESPIQVSIHCGLRFARRVYLGEGV